GPQAATNHQTFAPVMYPCPAPSLYMPQQYQYSPIPTNGLMGEAIPPAFLPNPQQMPTYVLLDAIQY
ncbi:hypothetical protein EAG_13612, partial [Camponotus floridanus]